MLRVPLLLQMERIALLEQEFAFPASSLEPHSHASNSDLKGSLTFRADERMKGTVWRQKFYPTVKSVLLADEHCETRV